MPHQVTIVVLQHVIAMKKNSFSNTCLGSNYCNESKCVIEVSNQEPRDLGLNHHSAVDACYEMEIVCNIVLNFYKPPLEHLVGLS